MTFLGSKVVCVEKMVKLNNVKMLTLKKVCDPMIIVFRSVGMWPNHNSNIFYYFYGILLLFVFSILFTLTMLIQLVVFTKREELTETSYMALTELALAVKIVNFYSRVRSMQSHLDAIYNFELHSDAEREHLRNRLKFMFALLASDFILTNTAHFSVQIRTITASEKLLSFPSWHPINWENNTTNYWLIFVYQVIGMGITSNIQVVIQQYPSFMFCMVSTQLEILAMRLQNIGYEKKRLIQPPKENIPMRVLTEEQHTSISYTLKDCINVHYGILK